MLRTDQYPLAMVDTMPILSPPPTTFRNYSFFSFPVFLSFGYYSSSSTGFLIHSCHHLLGNNSWFLSCRKSQYPTSWTITHSLLWKPNDSSTDLHDSPSTVLKKATRKVWLSWWPCKGIQCFLLLDQWLECWPTPVMTDNCSHLIIFCQWCE